MILICRYIYWSDTISKSRFVNFWKALDWKDCNIIKGKPYDSVLCWWHNDKYTGHSYYILTKGLRGWIVIDTVEWLAVDSIHQELRWKQTPVLVYT